MIDKQYSCRDKLFNYKYMYIHIHCTSGWHVVQYSTSLASNTLCVWKLVNVYPVTSPM